ncbi:Autotransporter assembly factor TamB [Hartmannibacter diazotrophicus]|uniref:Autotransporter assembly factor TamB n=1 Tax=Hartmannibacter diazotrophicus TaxID=1482074 RepID=A0A2C9D7B0_9HYPH|nr:translocation/assembly module TamB domain-containing protein [Hartmannibacter diazotrophicus]SON56080.1 Autotransporter assembly factor TamB [Hartmannibacter diazotrophicus]
MNIARPLLALGLAATIVGGAFVWTNALAQSDDSAERSAFMGFVEDKISSPNMQIRINGLEGALSSDVLIKEITVADKDGVYARIEDAHLVWSRLRLLTGHLDIDLLEAKSIEVTRPPLPDTSIDPAATPPGAFSLPQLPVSVAIDKLSVPDVSLGAALVGQDARLSVDGKIALADGALDSSLAIDRTDGVGGSLKLAAKYANSSRQLDLDLDFTEPPGGLLSKALNVRGEPSLAFTVKGSGPIDNFTADIALDANDQRLIGGRTTVSEVNGGYRLLTDLQGTLAPLVPENYADFVAGQSRLVIDGLKTESGTLTLSSLSLRSGVASLDMSADLATDGFPTRIDIDGKLGTGEADGVRLPNESGSRLGGASFKVAFGGGRDTWTATVDVDELKSAELSMAKASLTASGGTSALDDPARRSVSFDIDGSVDQLTYVDEALAKALGSTFDLAAVGQWHADAPLQISKFFFKNANAAANFAGEYGEDGLKGDYALNAGDISVFSDLAERDLAGAVELKASGNVFPVGGTFALKLDGWTKDLSVGDATADPLLNGRTTLSGILSRSEYGIHFTNLAVENSQVGVRLEGTYGPQISKIAIDGSLSDVGLVTDRAGGPIEMAITLDGPNTGANVTAAINSPALKLQDRTLKGAEISFKGIAGTSRASGPLAITGDLDGVPVKAGTELQWVAGGGANVDDFHFNAGDTSVTGALAMSEAGHFTGTVKATSPDIALVAPLFLTDASGALDADIALDVDGTSQNADVTATVKSLRIGTTTIGGGNVSLNALDLFDIPLIAGKIALNNVTSGSVKVNALDLTANRQGQATDFRLDADLAQGRLASSGQLAEVTGGYDLSLTSLDLTRSPDLKASLSKPVTVAVRGNEITIPDAALAIGKGVVRLTGKVADTISLDATIAALPLSIANAFAPDLAIGGSVDGKLSVTGSSANPSAVYDLVAKGLTATPLKKAGVEKLDLTAKGDYANGTATFDARTNVGGGIITAKGSAGEGLNVDATVSGLPLSLANAFQPGLGAGGTLSGTANATGTPAKPEVTFNIKGSGLTADVLRQNGIAPLQLTADGRYAGNAVTLKADATGSDGLNLRASGKVPLAGNGLNVAVTGEAPLSIANTALATRGAKMTGTLRLDVKATGSIAKPNVSGNATVDGATFTDPETGMGLDGIALRSAFSGDRINIERLSANTKGGGSLSVSGSVGYASGSSFPADLAIALRNANLSAGELAKVNISGDLSVSGPLMATPRVGGKLHINRAEITIPESLPASATLLDVRHRLPPPNVKRTIELAKLATQTKQSAGASSGAILDIYIDAPARIFVRGRGVDAELGGNLHLTGDAQNVVPIGGFELIRGRLDIIGQRVTFDSGSVTLVGDLDPSLKFVASTTGNNITVTVTVEGRVSDLRIVLSSNPELPEDEILAQFLFGRSIDELSPVQLAQLAAAVAQIAGGTGGPDILGKLRSATGLDDLDVVPNQKGGVGVAAGRYISDNIYLGVQAGADGARVSIDLDLTKGLKARVEGGSEGDAKAGLYYEKEY